MGAIHILVSGFVQGVGYRMWTERTARALALSGWVRNLHDGRVEIHAEGPDEVLGALVERCRQGPRAATVSRVEHRACVEERAGSFDLRPTARAPEG